MSRWKVLVAVAALGTLCTASISLLGEQDRPPRQADEIRQLNARVTALEAKVTVLERALATRALPLTQPAPPLTTPYRSTPREPKYWHKWRFNGQDVYIVPLAEGEE